MNKQELVNAISENSKDGLSKAALTRVVNQVFDTITEQVASGEKVVLAGFGTFSKGERQERVGRNPHTGEAIRIPAKVVPKFKAGAKFKDMVK